MINKLNSQEHIEVLFDLINAFSRISSPNEAAYFLSDLLTANEIKNLSIRLRIAKLLLKGHTQRDISRKLKTSLGTVNKVNIWLGNGGEGFKKIISKLPSKINKPAAIPKGPLEIHLPQLIIAATAHVLASGQEKPVKFIMNSIENKKQSDKSLKEMNYQLYSRKKKH